MSQSKCTSIANLGCYFVLHSLCFVKLSKKISTGFQKKFEIPFVCRHLNDVFFQFQDQVHGVLHCQIRSDESTRDCQTSFRKNQFSGRGREVERLPGLVQHGERMQQWRGGWKGTTVSWPSFFFTLSPAGLTSKGRCLPGRVDVFELNWNCLL